MQDALSTPAEGARAHIGVPQSDTCCLHKLTILSTIPLLLLLFDLDGIVGVGDPAGVDVGNDGTCDWLFTPPNVWLL